MITLRCTKRAAAALEVSPLSDPPPSSSPLGDWYVNLIPTVGGGFFLFTNERSLLSVVVPRQGTATEILAHYLMRVANILAMIGVPHTRVERELVHFEEMRAAKTANRRLLGVMNEFAFHLQDALEESTQDSKLSLSNFEFGIAEMPQATIGWRSAAQAALELLQTAPSADTPSLSSSRRSMH